MTVDVDGWSSLLRFYGVDHDPIEADIQVSEEDGASRLLDLFEKHRISATFFVPGDIARMHPNMVRLIHQRGHEVACHGLLHLKNEFLLERGEQESRIKQATGIIERIIGVRPVGFRAPCLRANRDTLKILAENGYLYDSSFIPTFIPGYYGNMNLNFKPYWVSFNSAHDKSHKTLLEMPVSVNPLFPIPLSAAWMRNLGCTWVRFGMKMNFLLGNPVVFYVHPRDVLSLPRVEGVPWHLYRNVGLSTIEILDEIITYAKTLGASFYKAVDLALALQSWTGGVS
jgi:hypothetical protein